MTDAQKRSRDINRKLEKEDRWFRLLASTTALLLLILASFSSIQITQINSRIESQVEAHRQDTEKTIQRIEKKNDIAHAQEMSFLKCIALLQLNQRTEATLNGCAAAAKEGGVDSASTTTNTTPAANIPAVRNATIIPESTPPPKAPEQPQPTQPVPTAPPPKDEGVSMNIKTLTDFLTTSDTIKALTE